MKNNVSTESLSTQSSVNAEDNKELNSETVMSTRVGETPFVLRWEKGKKDWIMTLGKHKVLEGVNILIDEQARFKAIEKMDWELLINVISVITEQTVKELQAMERAAVKTSDGKEEA